MLVSRGDPTMLARMRASNRHVVREFTVRKDPSLGQAQAEERPMSVFVSVGDAEL
jgi:hypothetical protein